MDNGQLTMGNGRCKAVIAQPLERSEALPLTGGYEIKTECLCRSRLLSARRMRDGLSISKQSALST